MADYFERLKSSNSQRPTTPGAGSDKARTEVLKTNLKAFKPTMVSNSVNKTALHPGGVEPSREHTEIEVRALSEAHALALTGPAGRTSYSCQHRKIHDSARLT